MILSSVTTLWVVVPMYRDTGRSMRYTRPPKSYSRHASLLMSLGNIISFMESEPAGALGTVGNRWVASRSWLSSSPLSANYYNILFGLCDVLPLGA